MHGAAALAVDGSVVDRAEDVGRHNAVDKILGGRLLASPAPAPVLVVSGRVSFEIVQKAAVGGFGCLVAVSAPTTLAVDTAEALGVTLAGFARDRRVTLYTHHDRISEPL